MAKYFLEVTIIKIYEKYGNIVFALPSLAAAIIFGFCVCVCVCVCGVCPLFQKHWDMKCFMKGFNSPKTALETKRASTMKCWI